MSRFPRSRVFAALLLLPLVAHPSWGQAVFPVTVYDPAAATSGTDDPAATNGTFRDAVGDANGAAGVDTVTFNQVAGGQLDLDSNNGDIALSEDLVIDVDTTSGTGILVDADGADMLDGTFNVTVQGDERLTLQDSRMVLGANVLAIRQTAVLALSDPGDPTRDHISDATAVQIQDTGSLRLDDDVEVIGSLSGVGTVVLERTAQATELTVGGDNRDTTYSGVISGTNGVLRKTGTGTLTLTGTNTHSGSTILQMGTIAITNAQALGAGGFEFNGTGGDTLRFGASLNVANGVVMSTDGIVDTNGFGAQLSGNVSGTGQLIKMGTGTLALSGNNTHMGGIRLGGGVLFLGSATALGDPAGTLEALGLGTEVVRFGGNFSVANPVDVQTNLGIDTNGFAATLSGDLNGGAVLTKGGAGTLTLSSAGSAYSGGTRIAAGEIAVVQNGSLGTGTVTFVTAGTSLDLQTDGMSVANDMFHLADAIYEVNPAANTATLAGTIGGIGSLNKDGAGTLVLGSAANGYQGSTLINAGTLQLGTANVLPDVTQVTIAGGATLATGNNSDTIASLAGAGTAVIGSGGLTFAGTDTATFSGLFTGDGNVSRQGTGTSILTGASTGFIGLLSTSGGRTQLTGSLGGAADTSGTGVLEGTGSIAASLNNMGRVSPGVNGAGTLTIGMDYTQGATGTMIADLLANGTSDLLDAGGGATLAGTLALQGSVSEQAAYFGRSYTVLEADGALTGTFTDVVDNLEFFTPTVSYVDNGTVRRVQVLFDQIARDFTTIAANENQANVARALQESLAAGQAGTDLRSVIGTVLSLPSDQAQALLQQMAGEVRAAAIAATLQSDSVVTGRVLGQLNVLRNDPREEAPASGDGSQAAASAPPARTGNLAVSGFGVDDAVLGAAPGGKWAGDDESQVWLLGTGIWGQLDPTPAQQGFDYDGAGFVLGYSRRMDPNWLVGAHAGFTGTNVETVGSLDKVEVDSVHAGVHVGWSQDGGYVDGLVNVVGHGYDSQRFIQATGIDRKATADYDADELSVYVESGQVYELGEAGESEQWHAQPQAALHYRSYMQDAYTETGAGDLNLSVLKTESDFLQSALGIRMFYTDAIEDGGWIIPEVMVRWGHEFGDVERTVQSTFAGTDRVFTTSGRRAERNTIQLRAGVAAYTVEGLTVDIGYNGEIADGQNNHAAVGRVVWKF